MDILICQACGSIIRGKVKFCTGCGDPISKFSPTALPVIANAAAPLSVQLEPDPIVLERAINRFRFATLLKNKGQEPVGGDGNGNGYGHGNGHGNGHSDEPPSEVQTNAQPVSRLSSVLGGAVSPGSQGGSMPGLVSLDSEPAPTQPILTTSPVDNLTPTMVQVPLGQPLWQPPPAESGLHPIIDEAPIQAQALLGNGQTQNETPLTQSTDALVGLGLGAGVAAGVAAAVSAFATVRQPGEESQNNLPTMPPPAPPELQTGALYLPPTNMGANPTDTLAAPSRGLQAYGEPQGYKPNGPDFFDQNKPISTDSTLRSSGISIATASSAITPQAFVVPLDSQPVLAQPRPQPPAPAPAPAPAPVQAQAPEPSPVKQPEQPSWIPPEEQSKPRQTPSTSGDAPPPVAATAPAVDPMFPPPAVAAPPTAQAPAAPAKSQSFFGEEPETRSDFFANTARTIEPPAAADSADSDSGPPSIIAEALKAAQAQAQSPSQATAAPPPLEAAPAAAAKVVEAEPEKPKDAPAKPQLRSFSRKEKGSDKDKKEDKKDEKKSEGKTIKIGGMNVKWQSALIAGIMILFMGFPILSLIGGAIGGMLQGAGSAVGSGLSSMGGADLNGKWQFGVEDRGRTITSNMYISQNGNNIQGKGSDVLGPFLVAGTLNYPNIQLNKQYTVPDRSGKPRRQILYVGKIDWVNKDPEHGPNSFLMHAAGIWQVTVIRGGAGGQFRNFHQGGGSSQVTLSGKWEAAMLERQAVQVATGGHGPVAAPAQTGGGGAGANWMPKKLNGDVDYPKLFSNALIVLLVIGGSAVGLSFKLFGPSGWINIWHKKDYIPSQFKSQHFKMVRELGKPLKPGGIPFGKRVDWNILQLHIPRSLAMPPDIREQNPHLLALGAGGKGKSRLLASMITHDIESNDRAVCVIDSDGSLADLVLHWMAAHPKGSDYAKRLIILDPTHDGEKLCYNPLAFPEDGDLQSAASSLVFGFKAVYTEPPGSQSQWNQQTANILRNAALLLLANNKTLTDLPVLLSENDFRDLLLESVEKQRHEKAEYTSLLETWAQYKRLARTDQWINWVEPILNRVQPMLGDPRIRPILTKANKGSLNLKDVIAEGKILLVKIPQSQLDQNGNLLGSLIVTGLKQAATSLSGKGSTRKHPCSMYLDQFEHFIEKETFEAITSETRKFQIGFIGASRTLQTLPEDYRNAAIINVGTMAIFALAKKDGDMLGPQMFRVDGRKMKHQTIQNIFNRVNTSPQFELISDEEKLNIDRVVGQEEQTYFCYRVGTVAGVFQMKAPDFKDIPDKDVNWTLIDQMYSRSAPDKEA